MQDIHVEIPGITREYTIHIGNGLRTQVADLIALDKYSKVFIITDNNVEKLWLDTFRNGLRRATELVVIPAGEQSKQIKNVEQIWSVLRECYCDRKSLVLILGGGVIGDLAAFAASTYMRGIDFAHVPTTLLAQIDSSIGGKTVIDFDGIKNLVGTFTQPVSIIIDPEVLSSLPKRELLAGFAEMYKYGLIRNANFFHALAQKTPDQFTSEEMVDYIAESVRIKVSIVANDEREHGERKLVNFGHTVGHAIEAVSWKSDSPLLHGEAIAIGMIIEADLSRQLGYIAESDVAYIRATLKAAGLPVAPPKASVPELLEKMNLDKKSEHGVKKFTLLKQLGYAIYDQQVDENLLIETLHRYMEE